MLHAYVERFDVMDVRENILGWDGEVNKALTYMDGWGCLYASSVLALSLCATSSNCF
jgi:hypothetical protein